MIPFKIAFASACLVLLLATQCAEAAAKTLELSCKGRITTTFTGREPISDKTSMGLIVDLTNKAVSFDGDTVPIFQIDDTTVYFMGTSTDSGITSNAFGHLDRISGTFVAQRLLSRGVKVNETYGYTLVCEDKKRLF